MDTKLSIRNSINRSKWLSGALLVIAFLIPFVAGCSDEDPVVVVDDEDTPPFPPDGVFSVTGDELVTIYWNANWEADLAGYAIFRDDNNDGEYGHIADVSWDEFCVPPFDAPENSILCYDDTDVINGHTYFYAVLAFDEANNESDLSYEEVYDTPRPEGFNLVLFDFMGQSSGLSGYDFSSLSGAAQPYTDASTDIFFGVENQGVNTIFTTPGVDIQDYGVIDLESVHRAPASGWAPSGRAEAIVGHSYVVRIVAGQGTNYAKFFVKAVSASSVTVDWAYQPERGEFSGRELTPGPGGTSQ